MADACHHALAQRYERGAERGDGGVLRDLSALAEHYSGAVVAGGEFEIAVPGGGAWIGKRVRYRDRPGLAARTFVDRSLG